MAGYRDLLVWQSAMKIAEDVYLLTESLPKHAMFSLTNQVRRAAISIPSNIAEGYARNPAKEFNHFLGVAFGPLAELKTQLLLAIRLRYLTATQLSDVLKNTDETAKGLKSHWL
ncbi:MAG: four helix bundle protein [Betaproteobacteria bacterium HGW-Betaproteobacteria-22]|nr:MAG: four helix bundle protein [Betaproteobacteria bacterium HGW-Betaproteobacteria-22]